MPEYINKQELLEKAKEHQNNPFGISVLIAEIEKADGVDIVFCKECKYRYCYDDYDRHTSTTYKAYECKLFHTDLKDGYCYWGERREK